MNVQLSLDLIPVDELPELVGDKTHDCDPLDADLKNQGGEMIAPHRMDRTRAKTQDGPHLTGYKRR